MKIIKLSVYLLIFIFSKNIFSQNVLEIEVNPKITIQAYNFSVNDKEVNNLVIKNLSKIKTLKHVPSYDYKKKYNISNYNVKNKKEIANIISDDIYKEVYNTKNFFSDKLSFVIKENNKYILVVSDYEGQNMEKVLISKEPILSPDIHKNLITYVSFENYRPSIFLHNLKNNKRKKISNFKGINSSPKFNLKGDKIIFTLSRKGNLDIYEYNIKEKTIRQITNTNYNELSPSYNDKGIVFSKESESYNPKVFELKEKQIKRLNNLGFVISNDYRSGTYAFLNKSKKYEIYIDNNKDPIYISDSIEKISLSNNGKYIIFSEYLDDNRILKVINKEGEIFYTLSIENKDLIEPSF
tara:strand:+ start:62345 stop:63403 length:1059 start_codon:yes stop_codon:yes gene_type:complete